PSPRSRAAPLTLTCCSQARSESILSPLEVDAAVISSYISHHSAEYLQLIVALDRYPKVAITRLEYGTTLAIHPAKEPKRKCRNPDAPAAACNKSGAAIRSGCALSSNNQPCSSRHRFRTSLGGKMRHDLGCEQPQRAERLGVRDEIEVHLQRCV